MKKILRNLVYILLIVCFLPACATKKVVSGPFLKLSSIETDLKKGISSKMDVQRILGAPQGFGGAEFPVTKEEHEVWFYQNIQVDNIKSEQSYITMDMDQKVLLIFFTKGLFDGYLWFTGTIKGTGHEM